MSERERNLPIVATALLAGLAVLMLWMAVT